jgi:hypothetical protein
MEPKPNPEQDRKERLAVAALREAIESLFAQKQNTPLKVIDICEFLTGDVDSDSMQVIGAFLIELKRASYVKLTDVDTYIWDLEGLELAKVGSLSAAIRLPIRSDILAGYPFPSQQVDEVVKKIEAKAKSS